MISGIGIDVISIERVNQIWQKFGMRFAKKVLHADEMIMLERALFPGSFIAKQIAAKEAFVKALGIGFRGIAFPDIAVLRDAQGKPMIQADHHLIENKYIHVSISDERHVAVACVVISSF